MEPESKTIECGRPWSVPRQCTVDGLRTGTSFDLDVLGARVRVPAFDASDRGWIERTADCQIQVHTLDAPLALDLQKVRARPEQRDTLLQHGAKIARANAITHLRKLQRAGVTFHGAHEDRFALVGGKAR